MEIWMGFFPRNLNVNQWSGDREYFFRGLTHWLEEHEVLLVTSIPTKKNPLQDVDRLGQKQLLHWGIYPAPNWGIYPPEFLAFRLKNPGRECRYQILRQPHIIADVKTTVQIQNHHHHRRRRQHHQRCCWRLQEIEISQPNHSCLHGRSLWGKVVKPLPWTYSFGWFEHPFSVEWLGMDYTGVNYEINSYHCYSYGVLLL